MEERNAMETVNIRNLRGKSLRENALQGKPLAITSGGALIGVVIPVAAAWVENLIDHNWSHVRQSITEGEQAIAAGARLATIEDLIPRPNTRGEDEVRAGGSVGELAIPPVIAALTGGTVAQAPDSTQMLARLQEALNPLASAARQEDKSAGPSVLTVRVGDLTAELIEKVGANGQTLAITHSRELVGILVPVTRGLVEYLIEQNMSRVLYNIRLSEQQIRTPRPMTTLDEALDQAAGAGEQAERPRSRVKDMG